MMQLVGQVRLLLRIEAGESAANAQQLVQKCENQWERFVVSIPLWTIGRLIFRSQESVQIAHRKCCGLECAKPPVSDRV